MTKGRDYYVYMFIDEQMAFASVFKNLLVVLLLYIFRSCFRICLPQEIKCAIVEDSDDAGRSL